MALRRGGRECLGMSVDSSVPSPAAGAQGSAGAGVPHGSATACDARAAGQHPPELKVVGTEGARGGSAGAPPAAHQAAPVVLQPLLRQFVRQQKERLDQGDTQQGTPAAFVLWGQRQQHARAGTWHGRLEPPLQLLHNDGASQTAAATAAQHESKLKAARAA